MEEESFLVAVVAVVLLHQTGHLLGVVVARPPEWSAALGPWAIVLESRKRAGRLLTCCCRRCSFPA